MLRCKSVFLVVTLLVFSGCGTIYTLSYGIRIPDGTLVYSGTNYSMSRPWRMWDAPASFIADTLALPYTLIDSLFHHPIYAEPSRPTTSEHHQG
jgi:uncharacterized protein YceK